ncbi:type IX secretion system periplasmic lipoprotein PorW/SprE [Wenyingzhuangia aestuarii]|uniref:type IX secretion system periplasmic lipoprotein PorW/SprE n=1 Tax=Wenyingzhuangia aestuarii TaxID=1647582 RepID=UPI0014395C23|nr:tetratricopeptide repeat protein [Wenyingzhuangia aestuarii]NJB81399.1 tetratricopeptide (TPR) repeat protein [Wenyingzhuangia aestuarii]
MKHYFLYISAFLLLACSTRKDKFVNRQYHALVTKYNVVYNGKLAFEKGLEKVENTYQDDFNEILPIEPFSFYADQEVDGDAKPIGQSDFERAEEKAVKAIQKHSMLIGGEEKNPQIDEAYLLLAKSRYYTKRFGPALESFEYIIKNYPSASLIYETVVWRAKANIHLDNIEFGKRALKRLLTSSRLSAKIRQQAEVGVVMAYQKTPDSLDQIATHLEAALAALDKGTTASRVAFVLGQVYRKKGMIKESDLAFDKVISTKNGLYKFKVQAQLEKINNHLEDYTTQEFLENVNHLIGVTKNRQYIGALLYEKGLIYQASDSTTLARQFFTESVQSAKSDVNQKVLSYEKLGDLSYDLKMYEQAKSYYDTLINVAKNKKSRRVIRIKRKSNSLEKIVNTQKEATVNDSLLKIARMNKVDLITFFENHIAKIRAQEKQARLKELRLLAAQNKIGFEDKTDWYFYNNSQRVKGKKEFKDLWKLSSKRENWYAKSLGTSNSVNVQPESTDEEKADGDNKYNVTFYTNTINRDPKFLDSVAKSRNLNYYELGNAYYNQLAEKELAVEKLEKMISFDPKDDLKIGAYYRLYKIYKDSDDLEKANLYRQKLSEEYPNSSFTKLVNNQNGVITVDEEEDAYITCYETIYELYKINSIDAAKEEIAEAILKYGETSLAPKYALLNAYIAARLEGKEAFEKELKDISFRYPNSEEATKAKQLLNKN